MKRTRLPNSRSPHPDLPERTRVVVDERPEAAFETYVVLCGTDEWTTTEARAVALELLYACDIAEAAMAEKAKERRTS